MSTEESKTVTGTEEVNTTNNTNNENTNNKPKIVRLPGDYLAACYPEKYDELFLEKQKRLRELLSLPDSQAIEAFASPTEHFRMRANFQMWHDNVKDKSNPLEFYYCMFDNEERNRELRSTPREITTFPRGTVRINELMKQMYEICCENTIIYDSLFEIRFLTTKYNQQALVVLCYKKPLHKQWLEEAEKISAKLQVKIIGRARKMKVVTGGNQDDEYIEERLEILGKEYIYYQTEGAFSQPNAAVCEKMITWAMNMTANSHDHDLLELYCGGGTFTAPLSKNFKQVLATEISKASVEIAGRCFKANHIENIKVAKLSSEEFTEFYTGKRVFQRLHVSGITKDAFNIGTVFVDPPRAGLDEGTCKLISRFNKIVYVSCNPETLARDVKMLSETHTLTHVAAFDQFPYTHHLESGVVMIRKPDAPVAIDEEVVVNSNEESGESAAKRARVENSDDDKSNNF